MDKNRQHGVTLIELVIAIVIISMSAVVLLTAFYTSTKNSADGIEYTRQINLAQLYLDEILAMRFDEADSLGGLIPYSGGCRVGADAGETRQNFDDVDDYNGLSESPQFIDSTIDSIYNNYIISISVKCDNTLALNSGNQLKLITVTVTAPNNDDFRISAYKGKY